jgi:hypothetical protein
VDQQGVSSAGGATRIGSPPGPGASGTGISPASAPAAPLEFHPGRARPAGSFCPAGREIRPIPNTVLPDWPSATKGTPHATARDPSPAPLAACCLLPGSSGAQPVLAPGHNNTPAGTGPAQLPDGTVGDDEDGVPLPQDLCPSTPLDRPIDAHGCSLAEFCALQETSRDCGRADWNEDEGNKARDCFWHGGLCEPR